MDELEFDDFITFYYKSPDPERASEAIRWCTANSEIEDPCSYVPAAYFFLITHYPQPN